MIVRSLRRPLARSVFVFAMAVALPTIAAPGGPLDVIPEPHCYNATSSNADFEAYGPTDVNAQAGNRRVTVGENDAGTITVFKYPNPSYYNQVKYFALRRGATGRAIAQFPNEGSFAGVFVRTRGGSTFSWLRDWTSDQRYASQDTPVPVTTYHSPAALGLSVTATDLAAAGGRGVFERRFVLTRTASSPVRSVRLFGYENFNPIATRIPYLPITDWCLSQLGDQRATFDGASQAIVHSWQGVDLANGARTSVAFAFGWDVPAAGHQVGGDAFDPATLPGAAPDGYTQAPSGVLGGSNDAFGQVTGALSTDLAFSRSGVAGARLIVAGSTSPDGAVRALGVARRRSFTREMAGVRNEWRAWLRGTLLPASADSRVVEVAKRSLISLRLAMDRDTGAIVASADTQGPYGEDWIRDGSFLNEMLDRNGFHDAVSAHNAFYARVQTTPTNPSPIRPPGNWAMASYADGIDGAPIPWEIDETGLGIWTLQRHAEYVPLARRAAYLRSVYPAITRAADWLTICADPRNGMQCPASEDDNYTPSQSLHGAETVYLGLLSAIAAARTLGDSASVAKWNARVVRLRSAIDALYDPAAGAWREGSTSGNAYNVDYGDGGWLLWPVAYRSYSDPAMQREANAVRASMDASLASPRGEYEAKALLGLAYAWSRPTATQHAELERVLHLLAATHTTSTGLFGEAWERFGGVVKPVEDQPHVWEHALFYLAAIKIDGAEPYTFAGP